MKRLVVKVGSSTISGVEGALNVSYVRELAAVLARLHHRGVRICLVTSGAVGSGARRLGIERPRTVPRKQAAAAVGQGILMGVYAAAFEAVGLTAAQILLTRFDVADRARYTNARNTFQTLFRFGVIPVVNENDSVATEELRFGDNDTLSAMAALITDAELAVILSDVDGLYDPSENPRRIIPVVRSITPGVEGLARPAGSAAGTGGMVTKIGAARILTESGIPLIIASGREPGVITRAAHRWENYAACETDVGEPGTLFLPASQKLRGRKRWLAFGSRAVGSIHVNERARIALEQDGRSLLAAGITAAAGVFEAGDLVRILGPDDEDIGRGLVNFSANEIRLVCGHRSEDMPAIVGREVLPEVIHRDNLVLTAPRCPLKAGSDPLTSRYSDEDSSSAEAAT